MLIVLVLRKCFSIIYYFNKIYVLASFILDKYNLLMVAFEHKEFSDSKRKFSWHLQN